MLTDLRSSIHYYENIAENTENDPGHENYTKDMAIKLHKVLIEVENELRGRNHLGSTPNLVLTP